MRQRRRGHPALSPISPFQAKVVERLFLCWTSKLKSMSCQVLQELFFDNPATEILNQECVMDTIELMRPILKSQYHASLAMLRDTIERCPDALWTSGDYLNPFWRIAYHALYYTHFYLQPNADSFRPWEHHQTGIQFMDDQERPPDRAGIGELPHRPPRTGKPYIKEEVLAYWNICHSAIDRAVDALDISNPDCGFFWYKVSKIEHQVISLRHLQHHMAQLGDRIRAATNTGIGWVGSRH